MQKIFLLSISLSMLFFYACTEEGPGGNASIQGQVVHHDIPIPDALIFIKYGATEFPGKSPANYDDMVQANTTDGTFEINNLEKGDYYLYGSGYDAQIFDSVFGGIYVELKRNQALETDIPITE